MTKQTFDIESGTLLIGDADKRIRRVPITDLSAVGEYTTEGGPWFDDYFIVLLLSDGQWLELPSDAYNIDAVIRVLRTAVGTELPLGLVNSVEFRSQVIWPAELRGRELFEFKLRYYKPLIFRWIVRDMVHTLQPDVVEWLQQQSHDELR